MENTNNNSTGDKKKTPLLSSYTNKDLETIELETVKALMDQGYNIKLVKTFPIHYRKRLDVYSVVKNDEVTGAPSEVLQKTVLVELPPSSENMSYHDNVEEQQPAVPPSSSPVKDYSKDPIAKLLDSPYKSKSGTIYLPNLINPKLPGLHYNTFEAPASHSPKSPGKSQISDLARKIPSPRDAMKDQTVFVFPPVSNSVNIEANNLPTATTDNPMDNPKVKRFLMKDPRFRFATKLESRQ